MKFLLSCLFGITFFTCFSQQNQYKLKFEKEAIDDKSYTIYVENPTKQLRSFKLTVKTKNIKNGNTLFLTDTISPETRRKIFVIKKEKKKYDAIIGFSWLEAIGSVHIRKTLGHKYQLPYAQGKAFKVVHGYNDPKYHPNTFALDFEMPEGEPVFAIRSGQIFAVKLTESEACPRKECERFANYIKVLHYDGTVAIYKNLMPNCTNKRVGDFINAGDIIAKSGFTGRANSPGLHLEVQKIKRDLSDYEAAPIEFTIGKGGKSDVLNKGDAFVRI